MKKVRIKNFGPISDAEINVKAFTIFGGANNTGKSFASRLTYSLHKSLQNDLYSQRVNTLISSLQHPPFIWDIENFTNRRKERDKKKVQALSSILTFVSSLMVELDDLCPNVSNFTEIKKLVSKTIDGIEYEMTNLNTSRSNFVLDDIVEQLTLYLEDLRYFDKQINLPNIQETFVRHQLAENIERELKGNFQIGSMSTLFGHGKHKPSVQFIDGNTNIEFTLNQRLREFQVNIDAMNSIGLYPSNLFLESPVYWKLETSLNHRYRLSPQERKLIRRPIAGVPGYVTFLRREIAKEYTGEVAFPEVLEWMRNVLGGKIVLSDTGQLRFVDGNDHYPLQTTATGITNIGMIGLLIERKLINERTVLFIDEPECNLHTAWHVVMAELLMKLSRRGVQVVIATHSAEILKYVANCSKRDPEIAEHVALNFFPTCKNEDQDFFSQLDKMLKELTKPYFELYWEGA